eukprot:5991261-Amphidinium_carterae.1
MRAQGVVAEYHDQNRDKRAAHYSEMAAALRNMPPPSDEARQLLTDCRALGPIKLGPRTHQNDCWSLQFATPRP